MVLVGTVISRFLTNCARKTRIGHSNPLQIALMICHTRLTIRFGPNLSRSGGKRKRARERRIRSSRRRGSSSNSRGERPPRRRPSSPRSQGQDKPAALDDSPARDWNNANIILNRSNLVYLRALTVLNVAEPKRVSFGPVLHE